MKRRQYSHTRKAKDHMMEQLEQSNNRKSRASEKYLTFVSTEIGSEQIVLVKILLLTWMLLRRRQLIFLMTKEASAWITRTENMSSLQLMHSLTCMLIRRNRPIKVQSLNQFANTLCSTVSLRVLRTDQQQLETMDMGITVEEIGAGVVVAGVPAVGLVDRSDRGIVLGLVYVAYYSNHVLFAWFFSLSCEIQSKYICRKRSASCEQFDKVR